MTEVIKTLLLAMTPIGELRVALPMGILAYGLDWKTAYFFSVLGNIIPVVFLLLFLGPVSNWLSLKSKICAKFFTWIFERTRKKTNSRMDKYGAIALISFVAIPLPFTGAWTGSIAAFLFGIPFKKAFPLIFLGVLMAGIIVLALVSTGSNFLIK